jgi:hypothetical protein
MWENFQGLALTRDQTAAKIAALKWTDWRPSGITLHNTAAPTLDQWAESGLNHDARIRNLESYYENELGWHAGPHFFVSRNFINWFSDPLSPGVHSRCWNSTRFGIEMVGDFDSEEFNSGDGALVRDNAIFLIACLNKKFGFDPADLTFHRECKLDDHACPGSKVSKADVIARVRAAMAALVPATSPVATQPVPPPSPPYVAPAAPLRFTGITATVFGGDGDPNTSAYDGREITDAELGVALPFHFKGDRPKVRVTNPDNGKSVVCFIRDVGPWNTNDPYWQTGARPQAESGRDLNGRRTNRAGIDLTPAAAKAIGIDGMGTVDWSFVQ